MASLTVIWRSRTGRLWRARVLDVLGEADVVAHADLREAPELEYGQGSRDFPPALLGSQFKIRLVDDAGAVGAALTNRPPMDLAPTGIAPDVVLESGRDGEAGAFSSDIEAGRGGYVWCGFLDRTEVEHDERERPAPTLTATCGLAAFVSASRMLRPGETHPLRSIFWLPGVPDGIPPFREFDGSFGVVFPDAPDVASDLLVDLYALVSEERRRGEVANDLATLLCARIWRSFDQAGRAAGLPVGWRRAPHWAPPLRRVSGIPDAYRAPGVLPSDETIVPFGAASVVPDLYAPSTVAAAVATFEASFQGAFASPDAGGAQYVTGLLPNGDFRHLRAVPGIGPVGWNAGIGFSRITDAGAVLAQLDAPSNTGWLTTAAWRVPDVKGLRASVRVRAKGGGSLLIRLTAVVTAAEDPSDETWYAAQADGSWLELPSAPTPGTVRVGLDEGETRVVSSGYSSLDLKPSSSPPAGSRLHVELQATSGSPQVAYVLVTLSTPGTDATHDPLTSSEKATYLAETTVRHSAGGTVGSVDLPRQPHLYVTGPVDADGDLYADPGVELVEVLGTGRAWPSVAEYGVEMHAAMRRGEGGRLGPRVEERAAFGLVTPDHLVQLTDPSLPAGTARRYVVAHARLNLRDETTEALTMIQVPAWDAGEEAWDWSPQPIEPDGFPSD